MMSVSSVIWNEIAETQPLKHSQMRELMEMDPDKLPQRLDQLALEQEAQGADPRATLAFATVAPLLLENEAISRYVQMKDNDSLRGALPEIVTMDEAVSLATLEYRLTEPEQTSLRKLLIEASGSAPN